MAGETVIRIAYGLPCLERDDPYVAVAEKAVMPMFVAAIPGNFLVDHLPILKKIPEWIPGTFKHHAKDWKEWALTMLNEPYADAKKIIVRGFPSPYSHVKGCLRSYGIDIHRRAETLNRRSSQTVWNRWTQSRRTLKSKST